DLYIADAGNNVIREVHADSGNISTVAGTGLAGYSGDGGQATSAQLNSPSSVAVDAAGDLFIADLRNAVVSEVHVGTNVITTVAGAGTQGYSGDGVPATAARLRTPQFLSVDASGNLFIADQYNYAIREVRASTGVISTVAGIGTAGYSGDGGSATAARLNAPSGVAVDPAGNVYIADAGNNVIRKISAQSGYHVDLASDTSWNVYSDAGLTNLVGAAQFVVTNASYPAYPHPAGAFSYNIPGPQWAATSAASDPNGAAWVWAPNIKLTDRGWDASYYFSKSLDLAHPVSGTI